MRRMPVGMALLVAAVATAVAQPAGDPPIEVEADVLEVRQNEGIATFSGNVDAVQGDRTLTADVLDVYYGGGPDAAQTGKVERIVARGNVVVTSPQEVATGDEGTYDLLSRTIELTGNVVLTREGNVLRGSRLEVDLETGVSRLLPQQDGGRVRALFVQDAEG